MKKIAIFLTLIVIVIVIISYKLIDYNNEQEKIKKENQFYEEYIEGNVTGIQLATIMNKAMDTNIQNDISKDEKGKFISNDNNSINIDLKMADRDEIFNMERIAKKEISEFTKNFGNILFKCKKIEYHEKTGRIKYILFEEIPNQISY